MQWQLSLYLIPWVFIWCPFYLMLELPSLQVTTNLHAAYWSMNKQQHSDEVINLLSCLCSHSSSCAWWRALLAASSASPTTPTPRHDRMEILRQITVLTGLLGIIKQVLYHYSSSLLGQQGISILLIGQWMSNTSVQVISLLTPHSICGWWKALLVACAAPPSPHTPAPGI